MRKEQRRQHGQMAWHDLQETHLRALKDDGASAECLLGDEPRDSLWADDRGCAPMPCACSRWMHVQPSYFSHAVSSIQVDD